MIEEEGRIVRISAGTAWVETLGVSGCSKCSSQSGCGQGLFAKMLNPSSNQIEVASKDFFSVGDRVVIGIPENSLVLSSLLAYGVPLLMVMLASVAAELLLQLSEIWVIFCAVLGLLGGILIARSYTQQRGASETFRPVLLRKLTELASPAGQYEEVISLR